MTTFKGSKRTFFHCKCLSKLFVSKSANDRAKMRQIYEEELREKKAAGKEAQEAVKCRTRKKDGRTVAFVSGLSKSRLVAIRKGEVKGGKEGDCGWPTRESVRPFKSGKTKK